MIPCLFIFSSHSCSETPLTNLPAQTLQLFPFVNKFFRFFFLNPLSANVGYIRHDTVVTSDSCYSGHSQNYEKCLTFLCKSLKFSTKWYTKLCILVDPFLRNCVTKSNFRYLKKKPKKRLWHLKG